MKIKHEFFRFPVSVGAIVHDQDYSKLPLRQLNAIREAAQPRGWDWHLLMTEIRYNPRSALCVAHTEAAWSYLHCRQVAKTMDQILTGDLIRNEGLVSSNVRIMEKQMSTGNLYILCNIRFYKYNIFRQ